VTVAEKLLRGTYSEGPMSRRSPCGSLSLGRSLRFSNKLLIGTYAR
jgi:hypothetical protein